MNKICILGLAKSGVAALKKAKELGYDVYASELNSAEKLNLDLSTLEGFDYELGGHTSKIYDYDTFVVSPGIPLTSPIIKKLKELNKELISEIEFGYRIKNKNSKIIAVTGSNGKSTTVSLIHHLLQSLGKRTALAGNIGTAFTSLPIEQDVYDYIILELSSFQLDLVSTFKADIAVILNITPDHLNRYESFDHYSISKFNITKNQTVHDTTILFEQDEQIKKFKHLIKGSIKTFSLEGTSDISIENNELSTNNLNLDISTYSLKGNHNLLNLMASILVINNLDLKLDLVKLENSISTFASLQHRLEFVAKKSGITFINDSKATNTDSVKYALDAFGKKVRIILGGSDKGEDFSILLPSLNNYAKKIYLIGATREKMINAFSSFDKVQEFDTFKSCIETAFHDSSDGDIVLLSPACASYDMFKNFEHRGQEFKDIVEGL